MPSSRLVRHVRALGRACAALLSPFVLSPFVLSPFVLASCSDAVAPPTTRPPLELSPAASVVAWGDTLRLTAPGGAGRVTWSSSDSSVVRVDSTGLATALRGGVARVEARADGRSGVAEVRVEARFVDLAAGIGQSCGAAPSGRVLCWGRSFGASASGDSLVLRAAPFALPAPTTVLARAVYVGRRQALFGDYGTHSCAAARDGATVCWGQTSEGQLGIGISGVNVTSPARPIASPVPLASLALGYDHACGLAADGTAYCWGFGFLSLGHAQRDATCPGGGGRGSPCQTRPAPVNTTVRFRSIAAGGVHSCGVAREGALYCWGSATPAGDPRGPFFDRSLPTLVGTDTYTAVATGLDHSCAITTAGELRCWGRNGAGQLGRGAVDSAALPLPLPVSAPIGGATQPLRFRAVSAGTSFTCAVTTEGRPYCWGRNDWGQLGDGTTLDRAVPSPVASTRRFTAVSAGATHACALADDGAALCWGRNQYGELGNGVTSASSVPVRVVAPE